MAYQLSITQPHVVLTNELEEMKKEASVSLPQAKTEKQLEAWRIEYMGTQGKFTRLTKLLSNISSEHKPKLGVAINIVKQDLLTMYESQKKLIHTSKKTKEQWFDVTMPGVKPSIGTIHPITKIIDEVTDIFRYLSFTVARGPEIELDEINFQKLRLPKTHPSRDTQETYYLSEELLLRVHTSSVQIRYMETHKPPIRIISPGRVYRRDQIDATHLPSFYQIEGLLVDKDSKLTDLLGTLSFFAKRLFGEDRNVRFYNHNFPYTEPSLEVEVQDKNGKWLEILGCGMVHPEVLENCGIDSKIYRGWAFGMGADRLAMLKYGISDIRYLYNGDLRFLNYS